MHKPFFLKKKQNIVDHSFQIVVIVLLFHKLLNGAILQFCFYFSYETKNHWIHLLQINDSANHKHYYMLAHSIEILRKVLC